MPREILYPAIAFLAVVLLVFAGASYALYGAWHTRAKGGRWYTRLARVERLFVAAAAIGLLCLAEGIWIEPYWPETTFNSIVSPRLASGTHIRIVHLTDIHAQPFPRLEERLPALVREQHPDMIAYTGDSVNDTDGRDTFRKLLTSLTQIAPVYAVKGNWDIATAYGGSLDLFGGTGAIELVGQPQRARTQSGELWLAGAPFKFYNPVGPALAALPLTGFRVFLYHTPDQIPLVAGKADLYLAGHTHGGQVRLPLYGAVVTMSKFGKRYEAGMYREGTTDLYVNRGIGMEGHFPLAVRFWCRPEIAVIDLFGSAPS